MLPASNHGEPMQAKLTKRVVDGIVPQEKDTFLWDGDPPGFGLKTTPSGRKVFLFQYRMGGRGAATRRMTIGAYGSITVDQARAEARRLSGKVAHGFDPVKDAQRLRQEASDRSKSTFGRLAADFIEGYAKVHQRNWRETERLLRADALPVWANRATADITRADTHALLQGVRERAPIAANRLHAALRKLFTWAVAIGALEVSPIVGLPPLSSERSRDRVLSDAELAAVLKAAEAMGYPFGPFVWLLALTAQRRDEVAGMCWSEISGSMWTIPSGRTKSARAHHVHLSKPAMDLLDSVPRLDGCDLVFTTTRRSSISGFSKSKERLDRLSGVTGWRFHDLRRTVTTGLANLGHPPHVADKILNHSTGAISGVASIYQRAEFLDERRRALDDWADHVTRLLHEGRDVGDGD